MASGHYAPPTTFQFKGSSQSSLKHVNSHFTWKKMDFACIFQNIRVTFDFINTKAPIMNCTHLVKVSYVSKRDYPA